MARHTWTRSLRLALLCSVLTLAAGAPDARAQGSTTIGEKPASDTAQPPLAPAQTPPETSPPDPAALPSVRLYMPDGQLKSHQLAVFVTGTLAATQKPRLRLIRSHTLTTADPREAEWLEPTLVASGQDWVESINDRQVPLSGTILLFDASHLPFGIRAMVRVRPALAFTGADGAERVVLGPREVNVGHIITAVGWTATVVVIAVLLVLLLAWKKDSPPVLLLTGVDGHLSLAQAQVACWTIVVGAVVLGYGLIRLDIPEIPESLLALMGTSLLTGGVAYLQDAKHEQAAAGRLTPTAYRQWRWSDLVRVFKPGQLPELSLAKAQMLFWTVLLLVLFMSKSLLEGQIWEVPWALVTLMGFSQAGYLAPKIAGPTGPAAGSGTPAPSPATPPGAPAGGPLDPPNAPVPPNP